ncbi:VOC family protein [Nocardiopsis baichengensis]|uniref:VOC family protein n=1 Tax=Nocardiopsis baichengensis TaxID=280240 RepID=UPI00034563F2|nr:VOC family protein [Nocardiopsis baichengensis]
MSLPPGLDHIVYAVPDLPAAVAAFTRLTGVEPGPGGSHPGWGTRNRLVGLGGGAYLELVGPDPAQIPPAGPRPFRVDTLSAPGAVTWAVRRDGLPDHARRARSAGYDPGRVLAMSRRRPDGRLLRWRLTDPRGAHPSGAVPFLIDWGDAPHPASSGLPRVRLAGLRVQAPEPEAVVAPLHAVGAGVRAEPGPAGLVVALDTPRGRVELGPPPRRGSGG